MSLDHDSNDQYRLVYRYLKSPTILFSTLLLIVYVLFSVAAGDFINPVDSAVNKNPFLLLYLAQCNRCILTPADAPLWTPWTLITSIFLHATILHLASNVFFLLIFGYILEEQIGSKRLWIEIFIFTGVAGNLTFLAVYALAGPDVIGVFGVGASGAVYGILGAAAGLKIAVVLILVIGLDIYAGGGFFAHIGGLVTGIVIRKFWITRLEDKAIE